MWDLDYNELYKYSVDYPEKYWDELGKEVIWSTPYTSVLEDKDSTSPRWYVGGMINMSYNCLDRQIENGYGDDVAVIHDSAITGTVTKLTYNQLLESVELLAGVMVQRCGLVKGDKVLLYFPMIPQCLISMLACTRIGVISTTVFGGFATKEFATRIRFFEPNLIITVNVGLEPGQVISYKERIDKAILMSGYEPKFCIIYNRPNYPEALLKEGRDLDWQSEIKKASRQSYVAVESSHPMFVTFTSGTTGDPKGMIMPTGGSVVLNQCGMKHFCGLKEEEVWWPMSDFAWIIGQSIASYGSLMARNKAIIYEGRLIGTPDSAQFARVLNEHKVALILSAPTHMKILRNFCSSSDLQLTCTDLRTILLGAEYVESSIREWTSKTFNCQAYHSWGQTELGGGLIYAFLGINGYERYTNENRFGVMMPGIIYKIVDKDTKEEVPDGTTGRLLLKTPISPAALSTLYKNHDKYVETYLKTYPGFYDSMDAAIKFKGGLIHIVGREDDAINVGTIRLNGSSVEENCLKNNDIVDAVVVALENEIKGNVPFAFLVPKVFKDCNSKTIIDKCIQLVLENVGEFACFKTAVIVPTIPRTIFGKVPRKTIADMLNGRPYKLPSSLANPDAFLLIHEILIKAGFKASLPNS